MELTHSFTVPASVPTTWAAFGDIGEVADCFPGATVTADRGEDFEGTCKVKLGPIAMVYSGHGSFLSRDESAGRFVLEAKGKDKRGNGTAGALVTATFSDAGDGSTRVEVVTDLQITGKPAQFGRGVIEDVSNKLLQQFVTCLQAKVGPAEPPVAGAGSDQGAGQAAAATGPTASPKPPPERVDAIDLGRTALPVLARHYGKKAGIGLLVLVVLIWLIRRAAR